MHTALITSAAPLLLVSAAAMGGLNGVDVVITNDGTEDMLVTVYDTSTHPSSVLMSAERINGFTRIPVSVTADETGRGNIEWRAVSVDAQSRKCGHAANTGLTDSTSVQVRADSECPST